VPIKTGLNVRIVVGAGILLVASIIIGLLYLSQRTETAPVSIKPYFKYSQTDIDKLKALDSDEVMTVQRASEWDKKVFRFVESLGIPDVDAAKLYTYHNVAQLDAAALSYQAQGSFMGDFSAVSKAVLCELYKLRCDEEASEDSDKYSQALAAIVAPKVTARIAEDTKQLTTSTLKKGTQYWDNPSPAGVTAASYKPWALSSANQFRAAPPPAAGSAIMREQLTLVKQALSGITLEQKNNVVQWAGGPGTRTPPGQWLDLAEVYMRDKNLSLDTYLKVRAVLSAAVADATIAVYDSKYAYQAKRPNMVDTSIITIMPTPNHPSYPAGHATISWTAATVLSHFLPESKNIWESNAKQASDSRVLGGIHFPIDNEAGMTQGKHVGNEVVRKWQ
jgi:hypothetical protein